ncbi:hypothetical protein OAD88_04080 [Flavobacteriaceae bacterium]|nr:hypothetical protein [Flavobacteriaceae bacterium]
MEQASMLPLPLLLQTLLDNNSTEPMLKLVQGFFKNLQMLVFPSTESFQQMKLPEEMPQN